MYPMVSDRLRRNILAAWFGVYPISLAVFSTSVRVFCRYIRVSIQRPRDGGDG